ncbi:MAG: hypothetical protein UU76_C0006G0005 [Parcubacteria group bacterium GW2011_GWC1_41_7]|nr:MAG: hypothetical protein UU76_C0006G0005 [Parcubacteria group bacterium GW2011_GWC1_41_7]
MGNHDYLQRLPAVAGRERPYLLQGADRSQRVRRATVHDDPARGGGATRGARQRSQAHAPLEEGSRLPESGRGALPQNQWPNLRRARTALRRSAD